MKKFLCTFLAATAIITVSANATTQINNGSIMGVKGNKFNFVQKNNQIQTELPIIEINTDGGQPIVSKDVYVNAKMKINGNEEFTEASNLYDGDIQIKGRGNSTWGMPKKPYRIKLGKKSDILGMGVEKDWILLANYADKTLMRNKLALDLGNEMGLEYTSKAEYVDVILNGEYIGNYLLCEQVEISETRIDIDELESDQTSPEEITGGYFFEVDYRLDEEVWFYSENLKVPFTFKGPKQPNKEQFDYITNYISDLEKALISEDFTYNGKHYSEYIDVDSFIDYYWINELYKNWDAAFRTSVNMYKPRDGKIKMGPIWDFDIGASNANFKDFQVHLDNTTPTDFWMREQGWYGVLFKDPEFVEKVNNRFWELVDIFDTIEGRIDQYADTLEESQKLNFKRWNILGQWVWPNVFVGKTYEEDVNYLKGWFNDRIEWLKNNIPQPEEPENIFDLNKDFLVTVGDLGILSSNIGTYNKSMDLNKDGKLDSEDLRIMINEILK